MVIIGGQSILGAYPEAPAALLASMEADVFPKNRPEAARDKDFRFTHDAARAGLVKLEVLRARLNALPVDDVAKARIRDRIAYDFAPA